MADQLQGRMIYNDLVDEQIDLENPEEVLNNVENIRNQPVDEVHQLSEGSADDVPSPQDEEGGGIPRAGATAATGGRSSGAKGGQSVWLNYNPADYKNLNISPEIRDLFKHITNYVPEVYELETQLKPFIPEYIPAIGEVDAMIKIPRPDGEEETLGISIIDEPKLNQSKRAVLDLVLVEINPLSKRDQKIHSVAAAHKNPREIQTWIENVEKIQKNRLAPSVVYQQTMPSIDQLMQAWDPEFEKVLDENPLPDAQLDLPIEDLLRYACALLDIPIHEANKEKSLVDSMHVVFSLYMAFNQHFQAETQVA